MISREKSGEIFYIALDQINEVFDKINKNQRCYHVVVTSRTFVNTINLSILILIIISQARVLQPVSQNKPTK